MAAAITVSCGERPATESARPSLARRIVDRGELIVVTRNAPTTFYEGRHHPEGLEYDLATAFAEHLGVRARFVVKHSVAEVLDALAHGTAHVAAAGLTLTDDRADRFLAGPTYQTVTQQVVVHRDASKPRSVEELVGRDIAVVAGSSYADLLRKLSQEHDDLTWEEVPDLGTEHLLERVWERELGATVADDNIVRVNRRYYPELSVAFDLSEPQELVWYFPQDADTLRGTACEWMQDFVADGRLSDIIDKYYGFIELFDYVDTRRFIRRIDERLPRYRPMFEAAGKEEGIPWPILAAVSYQESHWRPKAKSPTGVRGMMMLSLATAGEVGVTNRLDPEQSIHGGARYLRDLYFRLPASVKGNDRAYLTLAAYNVGLYHLYDARTLARRLGKNPDDWDDLEEVLPLLSQAKYYKTVPYGYARGSEPVRYVNAIRNYHDILRRHLALRDSERWSAGAAQ